MHLKDPTWLNIVEVEAESSLTAVQCFSQEELTMSILYYVEAIALQTPALHFTITHKAIGICNKTNQGLFPITKQISKPYCSKEECDRIKKSKAWK